MKLANIYCKNNRTQRSSERYFKTQSAASSHFLLYHTNTHTHTHTLTHTPTPPPPHTTHPHTHTHTHTLTTEKRDGGSHTSLLLLNREESVWETEEVCECVCIRETERTLKRVCVGEHVYVEGSKI